MKRRSFLKLFGATPLAPSIIKDLAEPTMLNLPNDQRYVQHVITSAVFISEDDLDAIEIALTQKSHV